MDKIDPVDKDEHRKVEQQEDVKQHVREEVNRELSSKSEHFNERDKRELDSVARDLKDKAIREVPETEAELVRDKRIQRFSAIANYVFGLIFGLIGLQILLELLGARQSSGFKQFMDTITAPILAPFKGLMPDPGVGSFQLMLSYLMALFVFFLLRMAVQGLLRLMANRGSAV